MRPTQIFAAGLVASFAAFSFSFAGRDNAGQVSASQEDESKPMTMRPAPGDPAPLTRLNDQAGRAVKIGGDHSDKNHSWTVLAFFPKAGTPG